MFSDRCQCPREQRIKIRSLHKNIAVLVEVKGRFGNVKIQEKVQLEAYSLTFKDTLDQKNFEALEDLEPLSPIAIIHINKFNMPEIDTKTIISEENLAKNVDEHRSGELSDELCGECNLSLFFILIQRSIIVSQVSRGKI